MIASAVNENVVNIGAFPMQRTFAHVKHTSRELTCIVSKATDSNVVVIAIDSFRQRVPGNLVQENR